MSLKFNDLRLSQDGISFVNDSSFLFPRSTPSSTNDAVFGQPDNYLSMSSLLAELDIARQQFNADRLQYQGVYGFPRRTAPTSHFSLGQLLFDGGRAVESNAANDLHNWTSSLLSSTAPVSRLAQGGGGFGTNTRRTDQACCPAPALDWADFVR